MEFCCSLPTAFSGKCYKVKKVEISGERKISTARKRVAKLGGRRRGTKYERWKNMKKGEEEKRGVGRRDGEGCGF